MLCRRINRFPRGNVNSAGQTNRDKDLRAFSRLAVQREASTDGVRAIANPLQAKMTILGCLGTLWIEAATVITNSEPQLVGGVFEIHVHVRGTGVFDGVRNG